VWVPNWSSSTPMTCDVAGSGSPTSFRAIPSNPSLWPLRPVRSALGPPAFDGAEYYDDHGQPRHAPQRDLPRVRRCLTPALTTVRRSDLLVSGHRRPDQRGRLRITVVDLLSVPRSRNR
jgi:hypothetical protein